MTDPSLLTAQTILSGFANAGLRVASITAKDKLRRQLQKDLDLLNGSVSFSAEYAHACSLKENGISDVLSYVGAPQPGKYSEELSLFVLEAGLKLLRDRRPSVMYLSLTDFIQHRYAPEAPEAERFYRKLDELFGKILRRRRKPRIDGRPRHERHEPRRSRAQRPLAAGRAR